VKELKDAEPILERDDNMDKKINIGQKNANIFERFLLNCVFNRSKFALNHPFRYNLINKNLEHIMDSEAEKLLSIFFYILDKRNKKLKSEKPVPSGILQICFEDFFQFVVETNGFSGAGGGLTKTNLRKLVGIIQSQEKAVSGLTATDLNSIENSLNFFDFIEAQFLLCYYLNPSPYINKISKFYLYLTWVLFPQIKDKVPEFKKLYSNIDEYKALNKKKKNHLADVDEYIFQKYFRNKS
jgi:hypothetical protein